MITAKASAARPQRLEPRTGWRLGPSLVVASSVIMLAAAVGATSALLLPRMISAPPPVLEARLLGETTGVLAWDSPAARLAHWIEARTSTEER